MLGMSAFHPNPQPSVSVGAKAISYQLTQPLLLIAAFLFLIFPRYSLGPIPYIDFFAKVAKDWPNACLKPEQEYIRDSGVGQVIFRILPIEGVYWFGLLHFAALLCGLILIFFTLKSVLKVGYVYPVFRIILLGQIGYVLFRWVGSYDAFTFLLWGLFFFFSIKRLTNWALLSAFGLGFQHFEQASIGILGILLVCNVLQKPPQIFQIKFLLKACCAIVIGKLTLLGILTLNGHAISGRANYFKIQIVELGLFEVINNAPLFIWSLFGSLWIVVICFLVRTTNRRQLLPLLTYFIFCLMLAIFARDHSRVFVLTTFPALFYFSLHHLIIHRNETRYLYKLEVLTWITVPVALWENNLLGKFDLFGELLSQFTK
jgi:hypothetical protein